MVEGVVRFGVSTPPDLLKEFDEIVSRMGIDRSKAIQRAMRDFLTEYKWELEKGLVAGTVTLIYDHEVRGLDEGLTDIQHHYLSLIISTMHIHIDTRNCLLVIAVRGEAKLFQSLVKELMGKRGIKQLKIVTVTI